MATSKETNTPSQILRGNLKGGSGRNGSMKTQLSQNENRHRLEIKIKASSTTLYSSLWPFNLSLHARLKIVGWFYLYCHGQAETLRQIWEHPNFITALPLPCSTSFNDHYHNHVYNYRHPNNHLNFITALPLPCSTSSSLTSTSSLTPTSSSTLTSSSTSTSLSTAFPETLCHQLHRW